MDFITTEAPPHPMRINGKDYKVPRYLREEFGAYVASEREKIVQGALSEIKDEERRALFRMYHQPPPMDVSFVAKELTAPDGLPVVLRSCLTRAGVPAEEIEGFIKWVDPELQRQAVDELRSGNGMIAAHLHASGDNPKNPTSGPAPTSGGSPTTTETISQTLPDTSAESTQAA